VIAEHAGQDVVFLLGPADPGQRVEQQPARAARGHPSQLGAWTVDKNGSEPADLTIGAVHMAHLFTPHFGAPPRAYEGSITSSGSGYASIAT